MSCSIKRSTYVGEYALFCSDFRLYNLSLKRCARFSYSYSGHYLSIAKSGKWKLKDDTLLLINNHQVFKKFVRKNGLLCEVLKEKDDTILCNHCLKILASDFKR